MTVSDGIYFFHRLPKFAFDKKTVSVNLNVFYHYLHQKRKTILKKKIAYIHYIYNILQ